MEAKLIKKLSPVYNRRLREAREIVAVIKNEESDYHSVEVRRLTTPLNGEVDKILTVYPSIKKAKESLHELAKENRICPKTFGLVKDVSPCFYYQIGVCRGACIGEESSLRHNLKIMQAFSDYFIPRWPFDGPVAINENNGDIDETILVDNWVHIGTINKNGQGSEFKKEEEGVYIDTVKILKRYLKKKFYQRKLRKLNQKEMEIFTQADQYSGGA